MMLKFEVIRIKTDDEIRSRISQRKHNTIPEVNEQLWAYTDFPFSVFSCATASRLSLCIFIVAPTGVRSPQISSKA